MDAYLQGWCVGRVAQGGNCGHRMDASNRTGTVSRLSLLAVSVLGRSVSLSLAPVSLSLFAFSLFLCVSRCPGWIPLGLV
ncbi:hypothetical protein P170DRAFT_505150 [Aspergillus steynii IBT 23096]|uniref:Uncharacterized protein n=1 Tax=Aspergillus steynii IBT 23096 TaxID=1392250 RepID=A0A2I2GNC6_9EURO|nr:uncharacterized protein P170DRAFT_505150 [Aspergillus steynii IBT 23096]PLB54385.1 hypothetical protein P170DRAFT_505150 [Aspergillus steynii IBT 23096]